jgi:hypothetical protein
MPKTKKFLNNPRQIVSELLDGLALAYTKASKA